METGRLVEIARGPHRGPAPVVRQAVRWGLFLPTAALLVWLHLEGGAALFALVGPRPPTPSASMMYRVVYSWWHLAVFAWSATALLALAGAARAAGWAGWCAATRRGLAAGMTGASPPVRLVVAVRQGDRPGRVNLAVVAETGGRCVPLVVTGSPHTALTVARCALQRLSEGDECPRCVLVVDRGGKIAAAPVPADGNALEEAVRERVGSLAREALRVPPGIRRVEDRGLRDAFLDLAHRAGAVAPRWRRVSAAAWVLAVLAGGTVVAGWAVTWVHRLVPARFPGWVAGEIALWGGLAAIGGTMTLMAAVASMPGALRAAALGRGIVSRLGCGHHRAPVLCVTSSVVGGGIRHGIGLAAIDGGTPVLLGAWGVGPRARTVRLGVWVARKAWRRGIALRVVAVDTGADAGRGELDVVWVPSDPRRLAVLLDVVVPREVGRLPVEGLI